MQCSFACYFYFNSKIGGQVLKINDIKGSWVARWIEILHLRSLSSSPPPSSLPSEFIVQELVMPQNTPMNHLLTFPSFPPIPSENRQVFQLVGSLELDWVVHHPYFVEETEAKHSATCFKVMEAISWRRQQWNPISTEAALFICLLEKAEFGLAWLEL